MTTGRVAKIIDKYRVVVTLGRAHGIHEGSKMLIGTEGEDIEDPTQPGKVLEKLFIPKARVAVESVQEKICIARSDSFHTTTPYATLFSGAELGERKVRNELPLPKDVKPAGEPGVVKVGDPVLLLE